MRTLACLTALIWLAAPLRAAACAAGPVDDRARVAHVYDGDTVRLADQRKLRLVGLDTPELARDDRPAEPLAETARDTLRTLLAGAPEVDLRYDREKRDRYGRALAHLVLPDGRHASRVLLEQGLAALMVLPPNTLNADCYADAQQRARRQNRGIWALEQYRPLTVADIDTLELPAYRLVRGTITGTSRGKRYDVIELADDDGRLDLLVKHNERSYFKSIWSELTVNRRLEVQGWINPSRERGTFVRLRHPSALQLLEP